MQRVLIATSNLGKLRDFAGAAQHPSEPNTGSLGTPAAAHGVTVAALPDFDSLPRVREDGATFEANARKKAEHYSRFAPSEIVLADDSGLEVDALGGAPGVHSARYAAASPSGNADDCANNARLLRELDHVANRRARFVCVIAAARDGRTFATFRGEAAGLVLEAPRGSGGFGYDPLFFFPALGKTFAELTPEEKARVSHRGAAFRKFLQWFERELPVA